MWSRAVQSGGFRRRVDASDPRHNILSWIAEVLGTGETKGTRRAPRYLQSWAREVKSLLWNAVAVAGKYCQMALRHQGSLRTGMPAT